MFFICIFLLTIVNVFSEDFYSFTVKDAQGNDVSLEEYRGKVNEIHFEYVENSLLVSLGFLSCQCKFAE